MNNGLTQIEINGETVGLKFGLPALRMLLEKIKEFPNCWGTIVDEDGNMKQVFNESGMAYLLYFGYINFCMLKEQPQTLKFEPFMEYVDSVAHDTELAKPLNDVIAVWAKSREVVGMQERNNQEQEGSKKKTGQRTK